MQKCYLEMQKAIVYQKDYLAEFMGPNDVSFQIEIFSTTQRSAYRVFC